MYVAELELELKHHFDSPLLQSRDVSDMSWGRLQFCVAAVSQKLLSYNIIAF